MLPSDLWLSRQSVSYRAGSKRRCSTYLTEYKKKPAGVLDFCTKSSRRNGVGITKNSISSNSNRTSQRQCCLFKATNINHRTYHPFHHPRRSNKSHGRASSTLFYVVPTSRHQRILTRATMWLLCTSLRNLITANINLISLGLPHSYKRRTLRSGDVTDHPSCARQAWRCTHIALMEAWRFGKILHIAEMMVAKVYPIAICSMIMTSVLVEDLMGWQYITNIIQRYL